MLTSLVYKNIKDKNATSSLMKESNKAGNKRTVQDDKHTN